MTDARKENPRFDAPLPYEKMKFYKVETRELRVFSNVFHKTKFLYVILSGGQSPKSNFCGLSEANEQKREPQGEAGYGYKFWWLFKVNVTFASASHGDSKPYPCVAIAPWFCSVHHSAKLRLRKPLCAFLRSE